MLYGFCTYYRIIYKLDSLHITLFYCGHRKFSTRYRIDYRLSYCILMSFQIIKFLLLTLTADVTGYLIITSGDAGKTVSRVQYAHN